jgi:hypothetical protein
MIGEAGAVVRVVLDRRRDDVQAPLAARAQARDGCEGRIERCQARAFRVARDGLALGLGEVVVEPAMALRERLRVRADGRDAGEVVDLRSRLWRTNRLVSPMMNSGVVEELVERARHHASVEFSTGTTPKSARAAVVTRKTSSTLVHGTRTIDEP